MSKFAKLKAKLMSQGHSAESAGAIAYSAGIKKYGKKEMTKKAIQGKKK